MNETCFVRLNLKLLRRGVGVWTVVPHLASGVGPPRPRHSPHAPRPTPLTHRTARISLELVAWLDAHLTPPHSTFHFAFQGPVSTVDDPRGSLAGVGRWRCQATLQLFFNIMSNDKHPAHGTRAGVSPHR
eukprot:7376544-Prymnesium_polylepis.3